MLRESVVVVEHEQIGAASGKSGNFPGEVFAEILIQRTVCAYKILAFEIDESLVFRLFTGLFQLEKRRTVADGVSDPYADFKAVVLEILDICARTRYNI